MSAKCYLRNPKVLVEVQDDGSAKINSINGFTISEGSSEESFVIPFIIKVKDSDGSYGFPMIYPWQEGERSDQGSRGPYVPVVFEDNNIIVQFNASVENYNIEIYEHDVDQDEWVKMQETDYTVKDNIITLKPTIISNLVNAKRIVLTKPSKNNEEPESYIYGFNNAEA